MARSHILSHSALFAHIKAAKKLVRHPLRSLVVVGLAGSLAACAEVAPIAFTSMEGNWAPLGASCDETNIYFNFHDGLAQRVARYEPASEFLFFYKDVSYSQPKEGESRGRVSFLGNLSAPKKANADTGDEMVKEDWQEWVFDYHMNSRLTITRKAGAPVDKVNNPEDYKVYSLEKCSDGPLQQITTGEGKVPPAQTEGSAKAGKPDAATGKGAGAVPISE